MMRIIGGRLRGHQLVSFQAKHIRPTTDRVKESIFNKIQRHIQESRVLDLFAGTGNLSFEAHSRGACEVIAVEKHKKSLGIIRKNLKKLKIERGVSICERDVFSFLKSYEGPGFDIVFIDPPFTEKIAHEVMRKIVQSSVLCQSTLIVVEFSRHEIVDESYGSWERYDHKNFGDKWVSFFSHGES